jgi:hypothetical protein
MVPVLLTANDSCWFDRSCVVCVNRLHHARDNQDQQRLDQEEEKNGEAKNDDVNSGVSTAKFILS